MTDPHLRVERRPDGVVLVTLDHPRRRNMMSLPMTTAWAEAMGALRTDRAVRCVVVTGAGTAFCSGGDTGWLGADPHASVSELRERMLPFYRAWLSIRDLPVPTVAALNGPAIGAGACLALACDLRYAAASARFAVPFTQLGLHSGMAATWLLPDVAGTAVARDLLLTGRSLDAEGMVARGLVSDVLPDEGFLEAVLSRAAAVAAAAPVATRLTTAALRGGGPASFDAALQWEALAQPVTLATQDLQEGLAAAREKRAPEFTGR